MGFDCSICGAHKGKMAISYRLDAFHQDWEICRECDNKKEDLFYYAGEGKQSRQFGEAKEYFQAKLRENGGMRSDVRYYILELLDKYEKVRTAQSLPPAERAIGPGILISTGALPEHVKIVAVLDVFSVSKVHIAGMGMGGWLADAFLDRMTHIDEMRKEALEELAAKAQEAGATALTGVQFHFLTLSDNYYGIMATGTGVVTQTATAAGDEQG